jgi:DNA polymerase I
VTPIDLPFGEIWLHDFEFIAQPGERPDVVCLAAHELRSGRTLRLWRDELGPRPPYQTDRQALFVNFVANAECACHLALGWPLPVRVLDLSPAFRNLTNGRLTPEGKELLGALRYYGFSNTDQKHKDAMRDRIMRGWPFTLAEQKTILDYCTGDVDDLLLLLPKIIADPEFDLDGALYHGEFAAVSALMQHHGVPIDMEIFPQLADDETWRAVRDAAVPAIDVYGVYVRNAAGDWTFNTESLAAYLGRERIDGWPLTDNGKLDMKRETFDEMAKAWPQLEGLRQLRHMRDKMRKIKLAVSRDGRNRTVLWPFKSRLRGRSRRRRNGFSRRRCGCGR